MGGTGEAGRRGGREDLGLAAARALGSHARWGWELGPGEGWGQHSGRRDGAAPRWGSWGSRGLWEGLEDPSWEFWGQARAGATQGGHRFRLGRAHLDRAHLDVPGGSPPSLTLSSCYQMAPGRTGQLTCRRAK